jgi:hypothetical protein
MKFVLVRRPPAQLVFSFVLVSLLALPTFAQEAKPDVAAIGFSLDFPQSIPDHYQISVSSAGNASYDSTGKLTPDAEPGDPFHFDFTISAANLKRIFDLAAKAKFFEGQVDSGKHNLASTGAKVLPPLAPNGNSRTSHPPN